MNNLFVRFSLFASLTLNLILPITSLANCEGSLSPADFSLYKNLQVNYL